MTEENQKQSADMLGLASEIVAAYVSNNRVPAAELPGLIVSVHAALNGIAGGPAARVPARRPMRSKSRRRRRS